eukprot:3006740-Amphidinium_carterae.1
MGKQLMRNLITYLRDVELRDFAFDTRGIWRKASPRTLLDWNLPTKRWLQRMSELLLAQGFMELSARRPSHFAGLAQADLTSMRDFWKTVPAWEQGLLLKLWTRSIILRNRAFYLESVERDTLCPCGESLENLHHMLWQRKRTRHLWPATHSCAEHSWLLPTERKPFYKVKWLAAVKDILTLLKFVCRDYGQSQHVEAAALHPATQSKARQHKQQLQLGVTASAPT